MKVGRPKKHWGQNFLRNPSAVARIVNAIKAPPAETILEIGPGEGALTGKLAELPNPLIAIEIDPELHARLSQTFGGRIDLRHADALEAPLPDVPYRAVGNLPYNVGTPILRRIVADPNCRRAVFMLQKEVANRLVAKPDDEDYGFLTLYVRLFASARTLMTLDPGSFYPQPKVRSAVVVLDPDRKPFASPELIELISQSFRMRRKKLVNNLTTWPREHVLAAMERAGIDANARAETLALEQFAQLLGAL
jgi:16S rRNA (adenine1518-N6/adenine1519-N6)-dimethyltransferase